MRFSNFGDFGTFAILAIKFLRFLFSSVFQRCWFSAILRTFPIFYGGCLMKLFGSLCLLALCVGISSHKAVAQTPGASPSASATPAAVQSAPATQTTQYTLPPDKLAKSKALYDLRGKLRIIDTVYGLLILLGLLYFGVAARYRDWAEAAGKNRFVQALIFVALFLVTTTALQLPLDAYQQSISRQYGLSVQGWGSWFGDVLKGMLVGLVIFVLAAWGITSLIRKSPRRWWFYTWLCAVPFVIFLIFIAPIVIDPLFNKFEPLDKSNPDLVTAIQQVTKRGGMDIPRDRMFLM